MSSRILAGRYELMEKIGEGGMAVVFRAKDKVLSRLVAVKILRPEYTKDEQFIESFRKESQLAASIVDPNIVNVYDVGREGNIYYIVMELVEGQPLSDIIKAFGPMDPRRAVYIARQIAMALSTAHRHQLIHRDVKPHNVLLSKSDVAKIADFGIAKVVNKDTLVADEKEAVMGSIHYFSPEQARGTGVDERSDIYSLGIVLYEMLTGKVPFDGETAVEVAIKHMNEEMVPPSRIQPSIPQDVEDIILKATRKNPDERYKNVDEMITDLSFVKFSKPSDYSAELEARRAAGDITVDLDDFYSAHNDDAEQGKESRSLLQGKSGKKEKKPFNVKALVAVLLAIVLAIPLSAVIYNKFFRDAPVSDTVQVPLLVNLDYEDACEYIKKFDLTIAIELELDSDEFEIGRIMSQTPSEDNVIKKGGVIRVNVSRGPATTKVPNVVSQSLDSAKARLEAYRFKVGNVREEYNDKFAKGMVISQEPAANTVLSMGGSVDLKISLGAKSSDATGSAIENPVVIDGEYINIEIPKGSSGNKVGDILAEAGIVPNRDAFVKKAEEMGYLSKLRYGDYRIPSGATLEDIVKIMSGEKL